MNGVDWVLLAILLISLLAGLWRGLVFELFSLIGWVVAFFAAQWLTPSVAAMLPLQGLSDPMRYAVGFALTFLVCVLAAGLVASLSRKLVAVVGLQPIDRLLGAAFGALRGLVMLLALAVVIDLTPFKRAAWWEQSEIAAWLAVVVAGLKPVLPEPLLRLMV